MFDLQSFSSQKSMVSDGPSSIALARIRGLLTKLLHNPETGVLYLQNDDAVAITKGMICSFSDDNAVQRSINNSDTLYNAVCVALGDSVAVGDWGFYRFNGEAEILLIDGEATAPSLPIYVAGEAGKGTITPTAVLTEWVKQIGFILDDSTYGDDSLVKIVIERCCGEVNFNPE